MNPIDIDTAKDELIAGLTRERELRAELERRRTIDIAWQAEAARLRTALGEILVVVNAAVEQPPAVCQVRVIATDALLGKGDRVTLDNSYWSAKETLARLPVINDPIISEALEDL